MSQTPSAAVVTAGVIHPITPLPRATHFRLQKGGRNGSLCTDTNEQGSIVEKLPIERFDKDYITARWGFDGHYAVQFFQETEPGKTKSLGCKRDFGLVGENGEGEEVDSLVPGFPRRPSSELENGMGALASLHQIVQLSANQAIEHDRVHAEAALQATRDSHKQVLEIMTMFMKGAQDQQRTDPALAAILGQMAQGQQQTNALIAKLLEPEEEEEEEPDEEEELKALVKDVRKNGMGAVMAYAQEKGMLALIDMLPGLKEKLPSMVATLAQYMEAKLGAIAAQPPPMAQPAFQVPDTPPAAPDAPEVS
jgi:hypothetical protein